MMLTLYEMALCASEFVRMHEAKFEEGTIPAPEQAMHVVDPAEVTEQYEQPVMAILSQETPPIQLVQKAIERLAGLWFKHNSSSNKQWKCQQKQQWRKQQQSSSKVVALNQAAEAMKKKKEQQHLEPLRQVL